MVQALLYVPEVPFYFKRNCQHPTDQGRRDQANKSTNDSEGNCADRDNGKCYQTVDKPYYDD